MSRGLGQLQREIVRTLEASKIASLPYRGNGRDENPPWNEPGWVRYRGLRVQLAEGAYDLRASAALLAHKSGHTYAGENALTGYFVMGKFQAAFSRAVRGLMQRGELMALGLVPVMAWERSQQIARRLRQDVRGAYLPVYGSQVRFVSRKR
jgi:hypothetical protein